MAEPEQQCGNCREIIGEVCAPACASACAACSLPYCSADCRKSDSDHHARLCPGPVTCACGAPAVLAKNWADFCVACLRADPDRRRPRPAPVACAGCGAAATADGGCLPVCNDCGSAWYCGPACQQTHWATHRPQCRRYQGAEDSWRAALAAHAGFGPEVHCVHAACTNFVRTLAAARCPGCAAAYCSHRCRRGDAKHRAACAAPRGALSAAQECGLQEAIAAALAAASSAAAVADHHRAGPTAAALRRLQLPVRIRYILGRVNPPIEACTLALKRLRRHRRIPSANVSLASLLSGWRVCESLWVVRQLANFKGLSPESHAAVEEFMQHFMPSVAAFQSMVDGCTLHAVRAVDAADAAGNADWRRHMLCIAFQTLRGMLK